MRLINFFFAASIALCSCTSIQGVANAGSYPARQTLTVVCSPEMITEVLSKCSAVRSPQRFVIDEGSFFSNYKTVKLYFLQLHPDELERIMESLYGLAEVKQVTVQENF